MKIHNCVQGSPAWWELRKAIPTGSSFDRILTPTGKRSGQQAAYISELTAEIVDGQRPNFFTEGRFPGTPAMKAGRDTEPHARRWYQVERNVDVRQVGFGMSDDRMYGCSPDALVGGDQDGALELKCPMSKTHDLYLMKAEKFEVDSPNRLPPEYKPQVHGHLIVTCRPWVDFMSYVPGYPVLLVRVTPNDYTKLLAEALAEFLEKYHAHLKARGLKGPWEEEEPHHDKEGYEVAYPPGGSR